MSMTSERADWRATLQHAEADEPGLLAAAHHLEVEPRLVARPADDLVAVARLADRRGGHGADLGPVAAAERGVAPQRAETSRLATGLAMVPPLKTPSPGRTGSRSWWSVSSVPSGSGRAISSRTALVPTSMAARIRLVSVLHLVATVTPGPDWR